jgi:hypothetical protein
MVIMPRAAPNTANKPISSGLYNLVIIGDAAITTPCPKTVPPVKTRTFFVCPPLPKNFSKYFFIY